MKKNRKQMTLTLIAGFVTAGLMTSCAGNSGSSNNPTNDVSAPNAQNSVNWAGVPSSLNPKSEDLNYSTQNVETIKVNIFGFKDDVQVIYAPDVPANTVRIRLFSVTKQPLTWGPVVETTDNRTLNLTKVGSYICQMHVDSGNITDLQGSCYVKIQIFLPVGSHFDVFNVDQQIAHK